MTRKDEQFELLLWYATRNLIETEKVMAAIDDLNSAFQQLSTDVQALAAKVGSGTPDSALQNLTSQVQQLDQQVKTALGQ